MYTIIIRVVRQWWYLSHLASYLNETWWAHGHGPNSSYNHLWENMSCCHGIMTENDIKNGQMNVRIVKSQEEMGKIHSYTRYLHPCLNIFLYEIFRWPLTWPRYRSKVRKRLNPTSSLVIKKTWWYSVERVSMSRPKKCSIRLAMCPIVARSRDLKLLCQVTLNWETRIPLYLCISKQVLVLRA